MSGPSAKIILDSVNTYGDRLTTMEVVCHRFVLAEFNTHRRFSRNSASSRAIPVKKRLNELWEFPADPVEWPSEKPGMQGGEPLIGRDLADAEELWTDCRQNVLEAVEDYMESHPEAHRRLHKSLLNRLLEPFMWHTIIVSSTEWDNFFTQRCSPLAQPEIHATANAMRAALEGSTPVERPYGDWHMPYFAEEDVQATVDAKLDPRHISIARCARVSYLTQAGKRDVQEDATLYHRLIEADPPHYSPREHVATPLNLNEAPLGNFDGWLQHRHINHF